MKTVPMCILSPVVCFQCYILVFSIHMAAADFIVRGKLATTFSIIKDVNIGVMMPMGSKESDGLTCSKTLEHLSNIHQIQAVQYTVDLVNQKGLGHQNAKLGFIFMDDCSSVSQALTNALSFVPVPPCSEKSKETTQPVHDVVGVIGGSLTAQALALSRLLHSLEIPLIAHRPISDEINSRVHHSYVFRLTPPNRTQFRAIKKLLSHQGWTYVSVVYDEGFSGQNGFNQLHSLLVGSEICMAAIKRVSAHPSQSEVSSITQALMNKRQARVVVLIAYSLAVKLIIKNTESLYRKHFIWIGTSAWSEEVQPLTDLGELLLGVVLLAPIIIPAEAYYSYFKQLRPANDTNPWFNEFWEKSVNCSLSNSSCYSNKRFSEPIREKYISRIIDAVIIFSRVINSTLMKCRKSNVRHCINGPQLKEGLENVFFGDRSGAANVLKLINLLDVYMFTQLIVAEGRDNWTGSFEEVQIAEFSNMSDTLIFCNNFTWIYHIPGNETPQSFCSSPCKSGEAHLPGDVKCCWKCQTCRPNERLNLQGTRCVSCPECTWPDPETNFTTCKDIPLDVPDWRSPKWMLQNILALISFTLSLAIIVFYLRHLDKRIIENSSPLLSLFMLLANIFGSLTVMTFQLRPNDLVCRVNYLLFCISFTLMYTCLFIRSLCIYKTFKLDQDIVPTLRIVQPTQQMFFCFGLLLIQVLVCIWMLIKFPTWHRMTHKESLKKEASLDCDMPKDSLLAFLGYNLLLLFASACLAFKRHNVDFNYNESSNIGLCASIILVIWIAMAFAYKSAEREYLKTQTMSFTILLNQVANIAFLFFPKIYAVLYLQEECDYDLSTIGSDKFKSKTS